jgi:hypothetical protein
VKTDDLKELIYQVALARILLAQRPALVAEAKAALETAAAYCPDKLWPDAHELDEALPKRSRSTVSPG